MHERNIVLTGFMGTGKSTVGRRLAERLQRPFVDTDAEIERRAGQTIPQIFEREGEAAFRLWERRVARFYAAQSGLVIATGGGMLVDAGNRAVMLAAGWVFCLQASADVIAARLADEAESRPLFKRGAWRDLLASRQAAYAAIPHQIDTTDKTPDQVMEEIIALCQSESA